MGDRDCISDNRDVVAWRARQPVKRVVGHIILVALIIFVVFTFIVAQLRSLGQ